MVSIRAQYQERHFGQAVTAVGSRWRVAIRCFQFGAAWAMSAWVGKAELNCGWKRFERRHMDTPVSDRTIRLSVSRGFTQWLAGLGGSLALTTYQAGRLILLSSGQNGDISLFERDFVRPMGMAVGTGAQSLALATQFQVYRFNNVIEPGDVGAFDAAYVPHLGWSIGSVDPHDVGFAGDGRPLFVNTLYSCIASVSDTRNFRPLWKPHFISELVPEDRCHLNGMAMIDGRPRFVTAVSCTDVKDGWRDHRSDGGVVIDVESDEIVVDALSMPHSPRFHDGRLWILNSGAGQFGFVDLPTGRFQPIAFCPGYARGLAFAGRFAIVGLSSPRENGAFGGLPLDEELKSRGSQPFCGLLIVDVETGSIVEWARIDDGGVSELYDIVVLPGVLRPSMVGFKTDEIKKRISMELVGSE